MTTKAFVDLTRKEFGRVLKHFGEELPQERFQPNIPVDRDVGVVFLDLDGTIAPLGRNPSSF